jgi:hypothetical protein
MKRLFGLLYPKPQNRVRNNGIHVDFQNDRTDKLREVFARFSDDKKIDFLQSFFLAVTKNKILVKEPSFDFVVSIVGDVEQPRSVRSYALYVIQSIFGEVKDSPVLTQRAAREILPVISKLARSNHSAVAEEETQFLKKAAETLETIFENVNLVNPEIENWAHCLKNDPDEGVQEKGKQLELLIEKMKERGLPKPPQKPRNWAFHRFFPVKNRD